jgi:hypothetical protein
LIFFKKKLLKTKSSWFLPSRSILQNTKSSQEALKVHNATQTAWLDPFAMIDPILFLLAFTVHSIFITRQFFPSFALNNLWRMMRNYDEFYLKDKGSKKPKIIQVHFWYQKKSIDENFQKSFSTLTIFMIL